MIVRRKFLFCAMWLAGTRLAAAAALLACAMAAWPAAAWADEPMRINGKALAQIDDIMAETNHGIRAYIKSSLLIYRWNNGGTPNQAASVLTFQTNGQKGEEYDLFSGSTNGVVLQDTNFGIFPALSSPDVKGHQFVFVPTANGLDNATFSGEYFNVIYAGKTGLALSGKGTATPDGLVQQPLVSDATGGIFVGGRELFAAALSTSYRSSNRTPTGVRFFRLSSDGRSLEAVNVSGVSDAWRGDRSGLCSVAAGDFDGDDTANELALAWGYSDDFEHYGLEVYRITESGGAYFAERYYSGKSSAICSYYVTGCRLLAGDFDGDNKTELALVTIDLYGRDDEGYPSVEIYKGNGTTLEKKGHATDRSRKVGDKGHGGANLTGMVAQAADLHGDAKDEVILLLPNYAEGVGTMFLSVWGCERNDTAPSVRYSRDLDGITERLWYDGDGWLDGIPQRNFSLAAAPFTGTIRQGGFSCADLALSWASPNTGLSGGLTGQRVYLIRTELNDDGSFKSFADPLTVWEASSQGAVGLAAADFMEESVRLLDPGHFTLSARRDYSALLQVPPYHVDYIQAPWQSAPALTNFTYTGGSVSYGKSGSEEETRDTRYETRSFNESAFKIDAKIGGSFTKMGDIAGGGVFEKILSALTQKKLFGFNASLSGGYSFTKAKTETTTEASTNASAISMTMDASTGIADSLVSQETDMHLWRYPLPADAPAWLFDQLIEADFLTGLGENYEDITSEDLGELYVTYTMCDTPSVHQSDGTFGGQANEYIAPHEEGNLFSYPTEVSNLADFHDAQEVLSNLYKKDFSDSGFSQKLSFSERQSSTEGSSTTSRQTETAFVNFSGSGSGVLSKVPGAGWEGGLNVGGHWSWGTEVGNSESYTKTYSDTEALTVTLPGGVYFPHQYSQVGHTIKMQAFTDAAGSMRVGFAVDFDRTNAALWAPGSGESRSVYTRLPDPSLVLPGKFTRTIDASVNPPRTVWSVNTTERTATKIRGVTFTDLLTGQPASSTLEPGGVYRVSVPMYNASFVDAGTVTVALSYRTVEVVTGPDGEELALGEKTQLGTTTVQLGGWQPVNNFGEGNEPNKGQALFDWGVPEDFPEGDYEFLVDVDPDNALAEIHEEWSADVPGGNNTGRSEFSVYKTSEVNVEGIRPSAALAGQDVKALFSAAIKADSRWMSLQDFFDYAVQQDAPFEAWAALRYKGGTALTGAHVRLVQDMIDTEHWNRPYIRVMRDHFAPVIFPGRTRLFPFTADPAKLREARELAAEGKLRLVVSAANAQPADVEEAPHAFDRGSGGGCDAAGFGGLAVLSLAGLLAAATAKK